MKSNHEGTVLAMMQEFKSEIERLKEERDRKIAELYAKIEEVAKNSGDIQKEVDELSILLGKVRINPK